MSPSSQGSLMINWKKGYLPAWNRHLWNLITVISVYVGVCTIILLYVFTTSNDNVKREECNQCSWVDSKRNHSRFLIIGPISTPHQGIGSHLNHVAVFLMLASKYDLHLVFRGNFTVFRYGERIHLQETLGFTASDVAFSSDDPVLKGLPVRKIPVDPGGRNSLLKKEINIDKVVFDVGQKSTAYRFVKPEFAKQMDGHHGHQDVPCTSTRQVFQQLYWNAPSTHQCTPFASQQRATNNIYIALHIRRGDILTLSHFAYRKLRHCFYVSAVALSIRALSKVIGNDIKVKVVVFSDSPGDSLLDEIGGPVDMHRDVEQICTDEGVMCNTSLVLAGDPLEALQCFAAADVFIGSRSSFTLAGGMLKLNVKLFPQFWHTTEMQDAVSLDPETCEDGPNMTDSQQKIEKVVSEWNQCRRMRH